MSSIQRCCICLENPSNLTKVDNNIDHYLSILQKWVPEVEWFGNYLICNICTSLIDTFSKFREKCITNNTILKSDDIANINNNTMNDDEVKTNVNKLDHEAVEVLEEEICFNPSNNEQCNLDNSSDNEEMIVPIKSEGFKQCSRKRRKFQCEKCGETFTNSKKYKVHCIESHDMKGIDIKPFSCNICSAKFNTCSNLTQHLKYHSGDRAYVCTFCGKGFVTKSDLTIHEKQHLNKREYDCDGCQKSFNTHKDLRSHKLVVHTSPEKWKFQCTLCNKRFPIKSNYDTHVRRHTGVRPFSCHLCEKTFTLKATLQRHLRSHTNVRGFKCLECDKEYKDDRVMRIHMAKQHDIGDIKVPVKIKKYFCHICPKSFFDKNKLTRHLNTHSGAKPFSCDICDKRFTDKSYLQQHVKNSHKNVVNVLKDVF